MFASYCCGIMPIAYRPDGSVDQFRETTEYKKP
jgi:hypothetical protein